MKILAFIVSLALFLVGIYLLGVAFAVTEFQGLIFVGGIIVSSIGLAIPFHLLKRIDA